ncbi:MAG: 2-oxo acid dehydrogenase subunit E2 [Microbacteriaceae bacterium]|nr:2-oxo acid dehydrogenase subunit E2 [Microbacteriaceae bacterium]
MTSQEFILPDVGEGLTEAEIVSWKVVPGETIAVNQVLVEIETAKSLVELPSPFAGVVTELLAAEGTMVDVGTVIIRVSTDGTAAGSVGTDRATSAESNELVAAATATINVEADDKPGAVLVGYGLKGHVASRRTRGAAPAAATAPAAGAPTAFATASATHALPAPAVSVASATPAIHAMSTPTAFAATPAPAARPAVSAPAAVGAVARPHPAPSASASVIMAKPPIRKLAKDLGVDLAEVVATGLAGETTREDVVRHASQASVFRNIETPQWAAEREERIPVKGVRKAIASAMVSSAFTAPHVSLFVDVDASRTMEFVKKLKASPDFAGVKVSPLLIMAKAIIWAVRRNPSVNAQWTDDEIIIKHFVNFGIAAATPRGLIVPNIKEAQELSLIGLARAIEELTLTARDGKTQPSDMTGGTITITNIGVFGMDTGTPILNPGEVAIVALGTIKLKPWVVDGEVRARYVTTLGASFDHRVVDGDVASRFLADVASVIEEPALLLD